MCRISNITNSVVLTVCSQVAILFCVQVFGVVGASSASSAQWLSQDSSDDRSSRLVKRSDAGFTISTSKVGYRPPNNGRPRRPTKGTGSRLQSFRPEVMMPDYA